jgi:hypothetical protein
MYLILSRNTSKNRGDRSRAGLTSLFISVAVLIPAILFVSGCRRDTPSRKGVRFIQITDTHFGDGQATQNKFALDNAIKKINNKIDDGVTYDFAVITGDIGIEGFIKDFYHERQELLSEGKGDRHNLPKERQLALITAESRINSAIFGLAQEFGSKLEKSNIKTWLFLPGNNDLVDEDPHTIEYYQKFIEFLTKQLEKKIAIIDLCPRELPGTNTEDPESGIYKIGPDAAHQYIFIGFNNASFKNNDDPLRLADLNTIVAQGKTVLQPSPSPSPTAAASAKPRPDPLNSGDSSTGAASPSGITTPLQEMYVNQVKARIDRFSNEPVYLFYHIPEVADYYPRLDFGWDAAGKRLLDPSDPHEVYADSSWFVADQVRKEWGEITKQTKVRALFAGHFHDWRRETYTDVVQTSLADSYGSPSKLFLCPPLAVKRQENQNRQARGYRDVVISEDGSVKASIEWIDDTQPDESDGSKATSSQQLVAKSSREEDKPMTQDYDLNRLWAISGLVGLLIVSLLIYFCLRFKTQQRQVERENLKLEEMYAQFNLGMKKIREELEIIKNPGSRKNAGMVLIAHEVVELTESLKELDKTLKKSAKPKKPFDSEGNDP